MSQRGVRSWYLVHKWSSLVCTLFLLMLCLTGLPLIFHDEIDSALGADAGEGIHGRGSSGEGPGLISLDAMLATALAKRTGEVPLFMAFDNDRPLTTITTGPRPDARGTEMTMQIVDRTTGRLVVAPAKGEFTAFLLQLHTVVAP